MGTDHHKAVSPSSLLFLLLSFLHNPSHLLYRLPSPSSHLLNHYPPHPWSFFPSYFTVLFSFKILYTCTLLYYHISTSSLSLPLIIPPHPLLHPYLSSSHLSFHFSFFSRPNPSSLLHLFFHNYCFSVNLFSPIQLYLAHFPIPSILIFSLLQLDSPSLIGLLYFLFLNHSYIQAQSCFCFRTAVNLHTHS